MNNIINLRPLNQPTHHVNRLWDVIEIPRVHAVQEPDQINIHLNNIYLFDQQHINSTAWMGLREKSQQQIINCTQSNLC